MRRSTVLFVAEDTRRIDSVMHKEERQGHDDYAEDNFNITRGPILPPRRPAEDNDDWYPHVPMIPRWDDDWSLSALHVGEQIGKGGFGTVFSAQGGEPCQTCAVKQVELTGKPEAKEEANREYRWMKLLASPYSVSAHFFFSKVIEGKEYAFIVMERMVCSVNELLNHLNTTNIKLPPSIVKKFVRQLLLGLKLMHDKGILHNDVKPHNMLLTADGNIKISDFGHASAMTQLKCLHSTPAYMSKNAHNHGVRCVADDMFAVGMTTLHLITGTIPWTGTRESEMYRAFYADSVASIIFNNLVDDDDGAKGFIEFCQTGFPTADSALGHSYLQCTCDDANTGCTDDEFLKRHLAEIEGERQPE
eukprot:PhF_6_TR16945/c0_g1_i2/m.25535